MWFSSLKAIPVLLWKLVQKDEKAFKAALKGVKIAKIGTVKLLLK